MDQPKPHEVDPLLNKGERGELYPQLPVITQAPGGAAPDQQPGSGWMPVPRLVLPDCPPGLEYLSTVDQLLIHQKIELFEALSGFETKNRFTIKNSLGQKVFYAKEESDCCTRNCCGPIRPFDMHVTDNFENEVMNLHRPLACQSCCCPCCLQTMEVTAPVGTVIGVVEQQWSIIYPRFVVKNAAGDAVLRIDGPFCTVSCCCQDVEFTISSADGQNVVGRITKQWTGLLKEGFTDADNFGVSFPVDLDVRTKATLLGACFLIDMMYFERSN